MADLVALTGATGFIGSALLTSLDASGLRVRGLSRSPMPDSGSVEWIQGDLNSADALEKLIDGANIVIHCAGIVRGKSAAEFHSVNTEGTENLLAACQKQALPRRFLLISSLAAREPTLSWYACSKRSAEERLNEAAEFIATTVFRPTAVYGPGDREIRPLLRAMKAGVLAVPAIDSRFSLLHVNDLVAAIMSWVKMSTPCTGVYELDDGTVSGYTWLTLTELVDRVWGRSVVRIPVPLTLLKTIAHINLGMARLFRYAPMLTPGKVREILHRDWTCDNSALQARLDWRPVTRLEDAMASPALLQL